MTFEAIRLVKTYTMQVPGTRDEVFPLLCPVREYEWVPYWDCNMVYSESGHAEKGCVFETNFPGRGDMTWIVTGYDPPQAIQYTIFKPASHVWDIEIDLTTLDSEQTRLIWRHTYTGLTPEGNQYLSGYTDESHRAHLGLLERALVHFLKTGKLIEEQRP